MDYFSILIFIVLIVFLGFEGKNAIQVFIEHNDLVKRTINSKKDVMVCKDYKTSVIFYGILALVIAAYSIYYFKMKLVTFGVVFAIMPLFCIIFILEAIVTRTIVFYESGFLYSGKAYRYKSILKISDKKRFIRGYHVQMINDGDLVYVSKNTKPIMEEKLKEYKNRKKHKNEK